MDSTALSIVILVEGQGRNPTRDAGIGILYAVLSGQHTHWSSLRNTSEGQIETATVPVTLMRVGATKGKELDDQESVVSVDDAYMEETGVFTTTGMAETVALQQTDGICMMFLKCNLNCGQWKCCRGNR